MPLQKRLTITVSFLPQVFDDLLFPMHMNFKFFGMTAMTTFASFDVMKNADVERDFKRFTAHINQHF